jgi:hypothetical protein
MTATYRALLVTEPGGSEALTCVELPVEEPGAGQLRARVRATGVGSTDLLVLAGSYRYAPKLPVVPGYEIAATVDVIGPGVTGFTVGERVAALTVYGGYSELVVRDAAHFLPIPDGVSDIQAAAVILNYVTAWQMIHRVAKVRSHQTALVTGAAGGVGTAALQLLRLAGVKTYGGGIGEEAHGSGHHAVESGPHRLAGRLARADGQRALVGSQSIGPGGEAIAFAVVARVNAKVGRLIVGHVVVGAQSLELAPGGRRLLRFERVESPDGRSGVRERLLRRRRQGHGVDVRAATVRGIRRTGRVAKMLPQASVFVLLVRVLPVSERPPALLDRRNERRVIGRVRRERRARQRARPPRPVKGMLVEVVLRHDGVEFAHVHGGAP